MRAKFVLLVLLQVLLLTGIIAYREYWVSTGERIMLRTTPVDPRDIFRGDYVHLNYEITNLDLDKLASNKHFNSNEKVYIVLTKNSDDTWSPLSVSKTLPAGQHFIQGRARHEWQSVSRWEVIVRDEANTLHTLRPQWFSRFKKGDNVSVCINPRTNRSDFFKEDDGYKPNCSEGTLITGVIEEINETKFRQLNVEYGIESYFVEEGKGKEIESARNARELKVEVSLRKDGKGIITRLFFDKNPTVQ